MCHVVSDYQKALAARQTLDGQMNENALVKEVCNGYLALVLNVKIVCEWSEIILTVVHVTWTLF